MRVLRFVTAAFAFVQGVVFVVAPAVVAVFYVPAMLFVSVVSTVLPVGTFGNTLATMLAGGAQVLALVVFPALGWVRFGGTTEFQEPRAPTQTFTR